MKNFVKFAAVVLVAVSATVASAADLEFHGYARVGFGYSTVGGNQVAFMMSETGKSKFRLGNEPDWVLEPGFTMSFTKLDDKSAWGVHILPATYRRFNGDNAGNQGSDGGLNVSYKEFYFYGQNVPQLGGGEIWAGRRYFGRNYLGAITDSFVEAQDGVGAGVYDIPIGPAKLNFDISAGGFFNAEDGSGQSLAADMAPGLHVTNIPTFNKDSNLQLWTRAYISRDKTSGSGPVIAAKRDTGFKFSFMHVAGFGSAGNLTIAGLYEQNAYTDVQDNGGAGKRNIELDAVYGVNIASARTSVDAVVAYRNQKSVKHLSGETAPADDTTTVLLAGFRTDTQISGPFRFLLEVGYDQVKPKGTKAENLLKITPCFAVSGGNDPWSRPTFRLFYTYASWNDAASASVLGAWKDNGAQVIFAGKKAGSVVGIQAEGWW